MKDYIKKESFYVITRLIFEMVDHGISRKEIAERCGFSIATVGKVVSHLLSQELVCERRCESSAGRHAGLLIPSDKIRYLLLLRSDSVFSLSLTDFKGDTSAHEYVVPDPALSIDENIAQAIAHVESSLCNNLCPTLVAIIHDDDLDSTPKKDTECGNRKYLTFDREELVLSAIRRNHRRYSTLYASMIGSYCTLRALRKSEYVGCLSFSVSISNTDLNDTIKDIVRYATEWMSDVSFSPDVLIFENSFASEICALKIFEGLCTYLAQKGFHTKKSILSHRMSFSNAEAIRRLRKIAAKDVTDKIYERA